LRQLLRRRIEDAQQLLELRAHSSVKRDARLEIDANTLFIVLDQ
jgi:hypothetical protein